MCCKTKFIFSVSQNTSLNFNVYNMVRAWYIDDSGISAAKADITRLVDIKDVESITGLLYYKVGRHVFLHDIVFVRVLGYW